MNTNKYGGYCDVEIADTKIYRLWYGMLRRCYDKTQHARNRGKVYADCAVSEDWMIYSNFENDVKALPGFDLWYEGNDMQLDKDILGNGREYNRRNCCFVPRKVNMAYMNRQHPNITKNANDSHKVAYVLQKDGKTLVFESEKDACKYLGVVKCSVASCYRRGHKCKGYTIARMDAE